MCCYIIVNVHSDVDTVHTNAYASFITSYETRDVIISNYSNVVVI